MLQKLLVTWQGDRDRLCLRHHWPQKDTWHLCQRDNPVGLGLCGMIIYGHSMSQLTLMDRLRCKPPVSCTLSDTPCHDMPWYAMLLTSRTQHCRSDGRATFFQKDCFCQFLKCSVAQTLRLQTFLAMNYNCKTFDIDWFYGEVNSAQALGTDHTGTFRIWSKLINLVQQQIEVLQSSCCSMGASSDSTLHDHGIMHVHDIYTFIYAYVYLYTRAHTHTHIYIYICI